ncbi:MAG: hypothetical protein A2X13_11605 [Bacteroidetes bacterium GWC2_33_15]|nr:MAG: hypothetical protein A2X13_11605 [Bacteroidetes bacterium GWC2_33_15]
MNYYDLIKKIPFFEKKIKQLKGKNIVDIITDLVNNNEPLIIDIGSNRGQTIDIFSKIYKDAPIYAFEPTPDLYKLLLYKYQLFENIKIFNLALGDKNAIMDFNISSYSPTNSILEPNISTYKNYDYKLPSGKMLSDTFINSSQKIIVDVTTFDNFYQKNIPGKIIDIFKTDTQGFDFEVLAGSINSLPYIKSIICECQFQQFYMGSKPFYNIIEFLYSNGFYISNLLKNNYKERIFECDMVFINKNFKD